jgi:hypothetical protein
MHAKTQHVASLLLLARAMSIAPAVVVVFYNAQQTAKQTTNLYDILNFPPPFNSPAANTTAVLNSKSHVAPRR